MDSPNRWAGLRWHWQHTVPQVFPLLIVVIVAIYAIVNHTLPSAALLSAAISIGATFALIPVATRVYSRAMLRTGRVRIREVLRVEG